MEKMKRLALNEKLWRELHQRKLDNRYVRVEEVIEDLLKKEKKK